ncbi:ATPase, V0 complex, subunit E1/e2, partial [Trametes gibbosa]
LYILFLAALAGTVGWFATPKGSNQTLVRTSVLLTLACCYLMWMVTYLAQVHPL